MFKYKVVGRLFFDEIQESLNEHSAEGWRLQCATVTTTPRSTVHTLYFEKEVTDGSST